MSSQRRFSIALAAIALTVATIAGGWHQGELPSTGSKGLGRPTLDSGFVAVGMQPLGLEEFPIARRAGALNRFRLAGRATPLVAFAAAWMLLHLWGSVWLLCRRLRDRNLSWSLSTRAPPLPRLL